MYKEGGKGRGGRIVIGNRRGNRGEDCEERELD
jgi:hypothetical protein